MNFHYKVNRPIDQMIVSDNVYKYKFKCSTNNNKLVFIYVITLLFDILNR